MKITKYGLTLAAAALVGMSGYEATAQGAQKALRFNGTGVQMSTVDAVNLGSVLNDSLAYTDFTLEMWVKVGSTNTGNPPLLANKNYSSGANNGICFTYTASALWGDAPAHVFRFNFKPNNGTRRDYDMLTPDEYTWNHIAYTVDRRGIIKGYVNGVYKPSTYATGAGSIAADSVKSLAGALPMFLGTDGTGNYRVPFNGDVDEVRIWKKVRTEADIRESMCHRLQGNEQGLLVYYKMDDTASATLANYATATTGQFNGTVVNGAQKVASGAPVGDASAYLYTNSWAGQSLQLATANRGVFTIDSFGNPGSYLHVYQVNSAPDATSGLTTFSNNNVYFGTYASGDTFSYYPKYAYSNYTNAVTYANNISFFTRKWNADPIWTIRGNLYNNTNTKVLRTDSVKGSRQFFLANFVSNCTAPSALGVQNIQASGADLSWVSGGAVLWNIEYSTPGFAPGTGTRINAVNTNPYTLSGLQPSTTYQFYVKDSCVGVGSSNWAGPFSFTTSQSYSNFASGYALHYNGNGVQNSPITAVNLGRAICDSLSTTNFTIEMWVKMGNANTGNPPLMANKNYVSGANTGICWTYTASVLWGDAAARVFRFNFKPDGGTRRDYDMKATDEFAWNHLAITVDRKGFIKGYVNGVYKPSTYTSGAGSIAADSGKAISGLLPMFLATDGTGNYRVPMDADMDEVRIWSTARTEAEIRKDMCHKLQGNEPALMAYYRMNEASGNTVFNSATYSTGALNGTLVNTPTHVVSSAPIGDSSVYIYPASGWGGVSLNMPTTNKGKLTVDSITTTGVPGVHIYKVNSTPNFQDGISNIGTTDKYFGVYTADAPRAGYKVHYNYDSYSQAVANSANLHVYNRANNAGKTWAQLPAVHTVAAHNIETAQDLGVREYLLADFNAPACAAPKNIQVDSVGLSTASLSWQSAASLHNSIVVPAGQDWAGASSHSVNANHEQVTGLSTNKGYEYYLRDSCGAGVTSAWVGPFYFKTMFPCPLPEQVHADSTTMQSLVVKWVDRGTVTLGYDISWGLSGTFTDPTIGIIQRSSAPRFAATGLQANTAYDFFINARCNAVNDSVSGWTGPYTFKTDSVLPTGVTQVTASGASVQIYPNPAQTYIRVQATGSHELQLIRYTLYNNLGVRVQSGDAAASNVFDIDIASQTAGVYFLELYTSEGTVRKSILIQH